MAYRTDLATEIAQTFTQTLPKGVTHKEITEGKLNISTVEITGECGVKAMGKPEGRYITITAPPLYSAITLDNEDIETIAKTIAEMLPKDGLVLIVGLGNNDITPDAIGPRAVHQVLATRHIGTDVVVASGLGKLRATAVIAPGVMGQTGIETSEMIKSIAKDISPSAIIVIDALAARSASRLGNTIQISNTGISPGSGVMNRRTELSQQTLGFPVISIGVPTVVDAATLAGDLLDIDGEDGETLREIFEPKGQSMMITPKEIDLLIGHACNVVGLSINKALHPHLSIEDINYLMS